MIGAVNLQVTAAQEINAQIARAKKEVAVDTNRISDGYHTFGELYEHRIELFITVCRLHVVQSILLYGTSDQGSVWRTKLHSDGSSFDGWFVLGINGQPGQLITYHLPISKWDECSFAETLDKAPEFDGHTSADVLERLKSL